MNWTIVLVMHEHLSTHSHILGELIVCCRNADLQATGLDQIRSFGNLLQPPKLIRGCTAAECRHPARRGQNANDVYRKIH